MTDEETQPVYAEGVKPPKDQLYPGIATVSKTQSEACLHERSEMVSINDVQYHNSGAGQLLCTRHMGCNEQSWSWRCRVTRLKYANRSQLVAISANANGVNAANALTFCLMVVSYWRAFSSSTVKS